VTTKSPARLSKAGTAALARRRSFRPGAVGELVAAPYSGVTPVLTDWWWDGLVAQGEITVLVGEGGVGKGQWSADAIARITRGWPAPPHDPSDPHVSEDLFRQPGDVIWTSFEDDPGETNIWRLNAAGADVSRVHDLTRVKRTQQDGSGTTRDHFALPGDIGMVRQAIAQINARGGNVTTWIIDPLMAASTTSLSYNQNLRNNVLAPLMALAKDTGIAIILVNHFHKGAGRKTAGGGLADNPGQLLDYMYGSKGLSQGVRLVFGILRSPENPEIRQIVSLKSNKTPGATPHRYIIQGQGDETFIVWAQPERNDMQMERLQAEVYEMICQAKQPLTTQQICYATQLAWSVARQMTRQMEQQGLVQKHRGGFVAIEAGK
jgi:predicted transcriptional regulator